MSSKSKTETLDENSNLVINDDSLNEPQKTNEHRGEDQIEAAAPQIQEIKRVFKRKSSKRKKEKQHDKNGNQVIPPHSHSEESPADPKIPKLSTNGETTKSKLTVSQVLKRLFKKNEKGNKGVE